jgi:ribosomal protein S18 acetylase RimI-like enzyme
VGHKNSVKRNNVRVFEATQKDEAFVLELARRLGEARPGWRSEDEVVSGTVSALEKIFRKPRDDEVLLIAENAEGARAGFIYVVTRADFFTSEPVTHISEIAVSKDGSGVGRVLMDAAEKWAESRGSRYVSLNVHAGNENARAFYEHLGYDLEWQRFNKRIRIAPADNSR